MRKHSYEMNSICDFKTSAEDSLGYNRLKRVIRNGLFNQRDYGPFRSNLVNIFDDLESTISYVLQNKFCSKNLTFRVDEFEKFMTDFINGLCESDDWKKVTGKQLDYILNKPATYL